MKIEVYGRPMCDACEYALFILESNGAPYQYYNIENLSSDELTFLMSVRAPGVKEVPIVFVEGRKINELRELKELFERTTINQLGTSNFREEGQDSEGNGSDNQPCLGSGRVSPNS